MPKALELGEDMMTAPPVPKAAQTAPKREETAAAKKPKPAREVKVDPAEPKEPLQVRWPGSEVKAMKLAAIEMDFSSISDFMLTCFHAYMQQQAGGRK